MKFFNRVKFSTATTGNGDITVGLASNGFRTPSQAGAADNDQFPYVLEEGFDWEEGIATYHSAGNTITRTVNESSNSNNPLSLTGNAYMRCAWTAERAGYRNGGLPSSKSNLWGWWKATSLDGTAGNTASVSALADLSGNSRAMSVGSAPTWNRYGFPTKMQRSAVLFNGSSYLQTTGVPATGAGARTLVAAIYSLQRGGNYEHVIHMGTGNTGQSWGLVGRGMSGWGNHYWSGSANFWGGCRVPEIVALRYNGTKDEFFINGAYVWENTVALNTGNGNTVIGSRISPPSEQGTFLLGELALYSAALSDANLFDVMNYMANYWGIP